MLQDYGLFGMQEMSRKIQKWVGKIDRLSFLPFPVSNMAYEKKIFLTKAYQEKMLRKSKFRINARIRDKHRRLDRHFKDIQNWWAFFFMLSCVSCPKESNGPILDLPNDEWLRLICVPNPCCSLMYLSFSWHLWPHVSISILVYSNSLKYVSSLCL